MDRWKDSEVEKMKVGGNSRTRDFFGSQTDISPGMSFYEKYNSRTAALYRDKVCVLAFVACSKTLVIDLMLLSQILALSENRSWSIETSSARHYQPSRVSGGGTGSSSSSSYGYTGGSSSSSNGFGGEGDETFGGLSRYVTWYFYTSFKFSAIAMAPCTLHSSTLQCV